MKKTCLVAIAKNEEKILVEWVAHHLNVGFDEILIYDNESTDSTPFLIREIAKCFPVRYQYWPSREGVSPQVSAYNHALRNLDLCAEWVAFFDLDEFLVVRSDQGLNSVLDGLSDDVGAVGVNWLTLGSSGQQDQNYDRALSTFVFGPSRQFGNNKHVKSIVRQRCVGEMRIHNAVLRSGDYVFPSGKKLVWGSKVGIANSIEHEVMQLNHYQVRSIEEFKKKMEKGRAGKKVGSHDRFRKDWGDFLKKLDCSEEKFCDIDLSLYESASFRNMKGAESMVRSRLGSKRVVVHIGLPKTATSFLQRRVFPALDVKIFHRDNERDIIFELNSFLRGSFKRNLSESTLEEFSGNKGVSIISHENLSVPVDLMWDKEFKNRLSVKEFCRRLARFQSVIGSEIDVLVGFRRQDFWFASRYAESSKNMSNPGQLEFENRVRQIIDEDRLLSDWLRFNELRKNLGESVDGKVVCFFQEKLEKQGLEYLREVMHQLGLHFHSIEGVGTSRENVLRSAKNEWSLKGHPGAIVLNEAFSAVILEHFRKDNLALGLDCDVDLGEFGYY